MKTNKQTLRKEIAEILADYKYNDTKIETTEQVADVIISRIHTQAMAGFEIIVRNEKEALKLRLPDEVVERIKELSELRNEDFTKLNNEAILKMIVLSLDKVLFGFNYASQHNETKTKTDCGEVITEKKKKRCLENENTKR